MPRDATFADLTTSIKPADLVYFCAACGQLVTRDRWRLAMAGSHDHVFFNPAGMVFRVACFADAPGVEAVGTASGQFSWFRGYLWSVGHCRGCGLQLGWRYEGDGPPPIFFGLIQPRLVEGPSQE